MTASTLYLVAPDSLASWFPYFTDGRADDRHLLIGERAEADLPAIRAALAGHRRPVAVFLSSHDTLIRDRELARTLAADGHPVVVQSAVAALLGTDKVAMKRFFDRHGFATAPWRYGAEGTLAGGPGDPMVVKGRNSTQSRGIRLTGTEPVGGDVFGEQYLDGVEFSVVVHRMPGRCVTFPPVWKGSTSPRLVPPWRRQRLCPAPGLDPAQEAWLRRTSAAIAEAADVRGHLEVEFLLTPDGEGLVLEVNPRICGTLRLVAMATGVPVFSLHHDYRLADVPAIAYAAEAPYDGEPFNDPRTGVFATSRLTVAADTPEAAGLALARHGGGPAPGADPWTAATATRLIN
ncbi:ATP-binding protein [Paractinoplanes hotanensis]|uniref:ATP-grasp domain-containing protein n=1 Tax=Paractinoplanes hotanensis TaxID=2906497 RepID=A0ABT0YC81_9ACTN|nr:hypothetical protein [Actinoplanes hotanensis]MCM4083103.1 hypothetical protein [Actinoplanes hotanensis]